MKVEEREKVEAEDHEKQALVLNIGFQTSPR